MLTSAEIARNRESREVHCLATAAGITTSAPASRAPKNLKPTRTVIAKISEKIRSNRLRLRPVAAANSEEKRLMTNGSLQYQSASRTAPVRHRASKNSSVDKPRKPPKSASIKSSFGVI